MDPGSGQPGMQIFLNRFEFRELHADEKGPGLGLICRGGAPLSQPGIPMGRENGAQGRTRTDTGSPPLAPQASVSTNSTTWARGVRPGEAGWDIATPAARLSTSAAP